MDKLQFEDLMTTIINGFKDVTDAINKLNIPSVDKNLGKDYNESDNIGIPLDSVHHPKNPSMINDPRRVWDGSVNMWRKQ